LIELLVVIAIIALLVSILMPSLVKARDLAKRAACAMHVNNQLKGVVLYASEYDDHIPAGPDDPHPFIPGAKMNELADSEIWTGGGEGGKYNAHGVLILSYIPQPQMVFCPGDDYGEQIKDLAKTLVEKPDDSIRCSYMYRQFAGQAATVKNRRLSNLGVNNQDPALKVSALILDMNSNMPNSAPPVRTNHGAHKVTVGFADTHVLTLDNKNGDMTATDARLMTAGFNFVRLMDNIVGHADKFGQ